MSIANATYLAWSDTKARYKKSILGPIWLVLTNLIGILGLGLVWGTLLKQDMNSFVPSLTIALITWQLISSSMSDGTTTFLRYSHSIKNFPIPHSLFVMRTLFRHIINFFHSIVIIIGVLFYYKINLDIKNAIVFIFNFFILTINLYWLVFILAILNSRYRDIEYLINTTLPLIFFISPILFRIDNLPINLNILWLNPLSYFIEFIRMPLLGIEIPFFINRFVFIFTAFGSLTTYITYRLCRYKINYWI